MTEDQELAYLAGFFDGEGSVGVYGSASRSYHLRASVGGTDERSIRRFMAHFGGTVSFEPKKNNWRPVWKWAVTGREAKVALRALMPFLSVKREQAALALTCPISPVGTRHLQDKAQMAELARQLAELKVA